MTAQVLTYSPDQVIITIQGFVLVGVMKVEVAMARPYIPFKGIRGYNTRIASPDKSATIRLQVDQTSYTNDVLSSILTQDVKLNSGLLTVVINDKGGSSLFQTDQAFIASYPPLVYGQQFSHREWMIEALSYTPSNVVVGGNASGGLNLMSSVTGAVDYLEGLV